MDHTPATLTQGPILRVLTRLALPIMASAFLSTAYSITDMAWVGLLGSQAMAGIGLGSMFVWFSQGLATLARVGGQVLVGQAIGRGQEEEASRYAAAALQLVTVFGLLFGLVCLLFPGTLLSFFATNDPLTARHARDYLMIACGASVLPFLSFVLTGLFTAQGDSATPLRANGAGLVLNMILDPVLILGLGPFPRLEVIGAAIATVSAQGVVLLMLALAAGKNGLIRRFTLSRPQARRYFTAILHLGIPSALQGMLYCGISMMLTRLVADFGDGAIAVQRVGGQIESVSWNIADGFSAAMNAFAAQNYGAGRMDRVRRGFHLSCGLIFAWGSLVAAAFIFFPGAIASCFFHEPEVLALAVSYLFVIALSEPFMCVEILGSGTLSGLGRTKLSSAISIVLTGMRIPLAIFLSSTSLGLDGIWWALTISSVAKGVVFFLAFHWVNRRETL